MSWRNIIILTTMFAMLLWWVSWQLAAPAVRNEYRETVAERARVEARMAYHGLNGAVLLRPSPRGYEFYRDKQWCKL